MADIDMFMQQNVKPDNRTAEYYTILGSQNYFDEDQYPRVNDEESSLAKKVSVGNHPARFYIKVGTYGKIYNPIGMYSEGQSKKFLAKVGRKEYEFKEVNQRVFDMYTSFLKTKNLAWLNNAQREIS